MIGVIFTPTTATDSAITADELDSVRSQPINEERGERGEAIATPTDFRLWHPTPQKRMANVSQVYCRQLGRVHTPDELVAEYERQNMHTGTDDDGNRARLAAKQTDWQLENFDRSKQGNGVPSFSVVKSDLEALIKLHVSDSVVEAVSNPRRSSHNAEEMAVVLYAIELAATTSNKIGKLQSTVGNTFIDSVAESVGVEIDGTDGARRSKYGVIKRLLVSAGLAEWEDETYDKGRCKKIRLGPNHPRQNRNVQAGVMAQIVDK